MSAGLTNIDFIEFFRLTGQFDYPMTTFELVSRSFLPRTINALTVSATIMNYAHAAARAADRERLDLVEIEESDRSSCKNVT